MFDSEDVKKELQLYLHKANDCHSDEDYMDLFMEIYCAGYDNAKKEWRNY